MQGAPQIISLQMAGPRRSFQLLQHMISPEPLLTQTVWRANLRDLKKSKKKLKQIEKIRL